MDLAAEATMIPLFKEEGILSTGSGLEAASGKPVKDTANEETAQPFDQPEAETAMEKGMDRPKVPWAACRKIR